MNKIAKYAVTVSGIILASSFALGAAVSFLPSMASAVTCPPGALCPSNPTITTLGDVKTNILCNALNWLFTAAIVLSIVCIIWAGISYMKSGGGEGVSKATQALTYAIVGIVIAILAKGVPVIISAFINNGGTIDSTKIC